IGLVFVRASRSQYADCVRSTAHKPASQLVLFPPAWVAQSSRSRPASPPRGNSSPRPARTQASKFRHPVLRFGSVSDSAEQAESTRHTADWFHESGLESDRTR